MKLLEMFGQDAIKQTEGEPQNKIDLLPQDERGQGTAKGQVDIKQTRRIQLAAILMISILSRLYADGLKIHLLYSALWLIPVPFLVMMNTRNKVINIVRWIVIAILFLTFTLL